MDIKPGVKPEDGAAPAPETQDPAADGGTPAPEPKVPPTEGGDTPQGKPEKTYTQAEVNRIMHERTKDYAALKEQLESYSKLGSVEDLHKRLTPQPQAQPAAGGELDEDDKKFLAYLQKLGLKPGTGLDEKTQGFLANIQRREEAAHAAYVKSSEDAVLKLCDTLKVTEDHQRVMVRDMVAAIILNDPALFQKWNMRDPSVMTDAIAVYSKLQGTASADDAAAKAALAKKSAGFVKPPLPPGGIPAPITARKQPTDDERLDAAWESLRKDAAIQPEGV